MPIKSETKQKAHTKEEFIDYFDTWIGKLEKKLFDKIPDFIKVKKWDMTVYRNYQNRCLICGCPENNMNMKNSTSAYSCLICEKNILGEAAYIRKQEKLNKWIDKSSGMNLKEKLQIVKKSLMFGG